MSLKRKFNVHETSEGCDVIDLDYDTLYRNLNGGTEGNIIYYIKLILYIVKVNIIHCIRIRVFYK